MLSDGRSWTDHPDCVHPVLREVAVRINDRMPDGDRDRLYPFAVDLVGTASPDADLAARLALWCARDRLLVLHEHLAGSGRAGHRHGRAAPGRSGPRSGVPGRRGLGVPPRRRRRLRSATGACWPQRTPPTRLTAPTPATSAQVVFRAGKARRPVRRSRAIGGPGLRGGRLGGSRHDRLPGRGARRAPAVDPPRAPGGQRAAVGRGAGSGSRSLPRPADRPASRALRLRRPSVSPARPSRGLTPDSGAGGRMPCGTGEWLLCSEAMQARPIDSRCGRRLRTGRRRGPGDGGRRDACPAVLHW